MSSSARKRAGALATTWRCRSVGFYRDLPVSDLPVCVWHLHTHLSHRVMTQVTTLGFSADGTVLGVAYGHMVTLWDPTSAALRSTLTHGAPSERVR